MLKKIFGTFGTRLLNALCGVVTLLVGTRFLGREAWGIGATVVLDVSLSLIIVELLAGSGLVYFTPRKSFATLAKISWLWSFVVVMALGIVFYPLSYFPKIYNVVVPESYGLTILALVFVYSFHNFNINVLLGKERVGTQNILFMIQFMTQMLSMLVYIFCLDIRNADAFVYSLLTGYVVAAVCGFFTILPYFKENGREPIVETVKEMIRFGSMIQLSTFVTMINRRLSYIIIKETTGMADVGVYSSATQVSEATKHIGQSIALVQFSSISNMNDNDLAAKTTVRFLKLAVILTTLCMLVFCFVPTEIYALVFTKEFSGLRSIMISLSPGMVFVAANMIFSHYFSGINLPKHNLYSSLVGLAVTVPSLFILIPLYGYVGAGISVSLTYLACIVYQWIIFKKTSNSSYKDLVLNKEDLEYLISEMKGVFKK